MVILIIKMSKSNMRNKDCNKKTTIGQLRMLIFSNPKARDR